MCILCLNKNQPAWTFKITHRANIDRVDKCIYMFRFGNIDDRVGGTKRATSNWLDALFCQPLWQIYIYISIVCGALPRIEIYRAYIWAAHMVDPYKPLRPFGGANRARFDGQTNKLQNSYICTKQTYIYIFAKELRKHCASSYIEWPKWTLFLAQ